MQSLSIKPISISPWVIAQGVGFQAFWFACVIGQNQWLLFSAGLLCLHFVFTPQRNSDFKLLALALIGITLDSLLTLLSVFHFATPPYWLGLLWLGFIVSMAHSMKWLSKQPLILQVAFGGIAGCLSYLTGERFGAVSFGYSYQITTVLLFCIWACLLPALYQCLRVWEQRA